MTADEWIEAQIEGYYTKKWHPGIKLTIEEEVAFKMRALETQTIYLESRLSDFMWERDARLGYLQDGR